MGRAARTPATTGEAPGDQERPRMGRPPRPGGPLRNRLAIKGRDEWWDWLLRFGERAGTNPTDLIDQGLALLARRKKFDKPPPRT